MNELAKTATKTAVKVYILKNPYTWFIVGVLTLLSILVLYTATVFMSSIIEEDSQGGI